MLNNRMDVLILNADMRPVSLFPLSTVAWQAAIRAVYLGTVTVVAEYPDWVVHSATQSMHVPSIIMTRQYLHYQRQVAFSDSQVFLRDRYTCQYCQYEFEPSQHRLTLDHVLPRKYGGKTTWDNIAASCAPCNSRKGSNRSIVPAKMPRRPSYYEMVAIRKEFPITVPCADWIDYLEWPTEKIQIKERKILREMNAT